MPRPLCTSRDVRVLQCSLLSARTPNPEAPRRAFQFFVLCRVVPLCASGGLSFFVVLPSAPCAVATFGRVVVQAGRDCSTGAQGEASTYARYRDDHIFKAGQTCAAGRQTVWTELVEDRPCVYNAVHAGLKELVYSEAHGCLILLSCKRPGARYPPPPRPVQFTRTKEHCTWIPSPFVTVSDGPGPSARLEQRTGTNYKTTPPLRCTPFPPPPPATAVQTASSQFCCNGLATTRTCSSTVFSTVTDSLVPVGKTVQGGGGYFAGEYFVVGNFVFQMCAKSTHPSGHGAKSTRCEI